MDTPKNLFSGARYLYENKLFLDFTIKVQNQEFRVHKFALLATSQYFRAFFKPGMRDWRSDVVELSQFTPQAMSNLIHHIYHGEFPEGGEINAGDVLECASYLDVQGAINTSGEMIVKTLTVDNWHDTLSFLESFDAKAAVADARAFGRTHFREILDDVNENADLQVMEHLIEIWDSPEYDLFKLVADWMQENMEERWGHEGRLLSKVRFGLMFANELFAVAENSVYENSDSPWKDLVETAMQYALTDDCQKVAFYEKRGLQQQNTCRAEPDTLLFLEPGRYAHLDHTDTALHVFSAYNFKSWEGQLCLDSADVGQPLTGNTTVSFNGFVLFLIPNSSTWTLFDSRTKAWSSMPCCPDYHLYAPVVYHSGKLLVIGGSLFDEGKGDYMVTDVINSFDFETQTWNRFYNRLPLPLSCLGACSLGKYVYIAGGKAGNECNCPTRLKLDRLNLRSNRWESCGTMPMDVMGRFTRLHALDQEAVMYLDVDFTFRCFNTALRTWTKLVIPFRTRSLLDPKNVMKPTVYVGKNVIYLHFLEEDVTCVYNRLNDNYEEIAFDKPSQMVCVLSNLPRFLYEFGDSDSEAWITDDDTSFGSVSTFDSDLSE